ncbi:sulfotransferase 1E1-like [Culicoides brevitarsis]|uniref:sulfotransferase 1E1-like n=1 Tax=Culicoides brevitarsis TaxID=469753 RepID=UPI00307B923D
MSFQIQSFNLPVPNFAAFPNAENHKTRPDDVKFILKEPLPTTPLPAEIQKRFNSVVLPEKFQYFINEIQNLEIYEDDVWVFSFPRSGSNWTQEAVWQICKGVDTENEGKETLRTRFPCIEESSFVYELSNNLDARTLHVVKNLKRPRFIKTHIPIAFLPTKLWEVKPKLVYVYREAKDAAVSWYHFLTDFLYQKTLEEFLEQYLNGEVRYGNYWDHYEQYHRLAKVYPNMKVLKYEEMKKDLKSTLLDLCTFFNKSLSNDQIEKLLHHLSFENMKKNPANNYCQLEDELKKVKPGHQFRMIRQGKVNTGKEEMSAEMIEKFDAKMRDMQRNLKEL